MTRIRRPLTYSPAWSLPTTHHYCPTCCPLGTPYSDAPITKTPHARRQIRTVKQRPTTHRGTHSNRGISGVTNRKGNGNDDKANSITSSHRIKAVSSNTPTSIPTLITSSGRLSPLSSVLLRISA
ncbi:LOW QUALITY PROTEIN: hypothetical protein QC764_105767 [Podospora pseudoanserina]|uniref:Uncharacterized protein n=1 Tax=Podospora pseudoanserina TaxID=2609844 RepID=A0ABR0IMW6_9PEZI|nr:LOW QUALITY PROTEIN: hypothetical protein QC764_105767 [Podospora pseudoanserina]